jgi:hypothetical protein
MRRAQQEAARRKMQTQPKQPTVTPSPTPRRPVVTPSPTWRKDSSDEKENTYRSRHRSGR